MASFPGESLMLLGESPLEAPTIARLFMGWSYAGQSSGRQIVVRLVSLFSSASVVGTS